MDSENVGVSVDCSSWRRGGQKKKRLKLRLCGCILAYGNNNKNNNECKGEE